MSQSEAKTGIPVMCWSCSAALESPTFCGACRRIQPLPPETDYFAMLGVPRKLGLDAAELEQRFHQWSWKLHPDHFVRATEYERNLSLARSSQLNDAYRTLRDPITRLEYLLAQEGMRKEGQNKQQAPPELLEEVFALNESLDELRAARRAGGEVAGVRDRLQAAQGHLEEKLGQLDAALGQASAEWDAAPAAGAERQKLMAQMNDLLNRRSYIRNLVQNVQKELAEA